MRRPLPVILVTLLLVGISASLITWLWFELKLGGDPDARPTTTANSPAVAPRVPADSQLEDAKSDKKGLRVLFVGNSHTFTNDVPGLVTKLAAAGSVERPLLAYSEAPGGTSFRMHWENGRVQKLLQDVKWDLVVLQDQSSMPNYSKAERDLETLPFARNLDKAIRESGARTVLFMTWGYQPDFAAMQVRSRLAYQDLASALGAELVPVGTAWERAIAKRRDLALWSGDGNHADMRGSYLAACAFFAAFYGKSPVGNSFTAGLNVEEAAFLQEAATGVVKMQPGGLAAKAR